MSLKAIALYIIPKMPQNRPATIIPVNDKTNPVIALPEKFLTAGSQDCSLPATTSPHYFVSFFWFKSSVCTIDAPQETQNLESSAFL